MADNINNNISSDIYGLNAYVNEIRKNFTPETDPSTMMLSTFGFYTKTFSNILQNTVVMASEFSNESIASKAKFEKNIIAHALGLGMTDINAVPASFDVLLTFLEEDIERSLHIDENKPWTFVFDKEHSIYFGEYEFHPDYDIIINKVRVTTAGPGKNFAYTARYDIDVDNPISGITNPYLSPPIRMKMQGLRVIMVECKLHQVTKTQIQTKILSDSSIASKIITFQYEGQLASFTIDVKTAEGNVHLVPVYEGLMLLAVNTKYPYFYYTYLDENTIRVKFDRNSFIPTVNNDITVNIQTTKGVDGNFTFSDTVWPAFNFSSERFGYTNITCEVRPVTCISSEGTDKKTVAELKKIIPKEALSRGSITNLTDLQNYFNVISSMGQLHLYKKRDNALHRLYYTYMVMKNSMDNIVPTNTIDIKVTADQLLHEEDGKWVFKRGTLIRYNRNTQYGYIADNINEETGLPDDFNPESFDDFLYTIPYSFAISKSPLYGMYYLTTINETKALDFTAINENCIYQYIATSINFRRGYINNPDKYVLSVDVQQNVIDSDPTLVTYSTPTNPDDPNFVPKIIDSKVRCYMVFFTNEGSAYKWAKAKIVNFDSGSGNLFTFQFIFYTSDLIDINNRIKINSGIYNPGSNVETYGYFKNNTVAKLYIVSSQEKEKGLDDGITNLAAIIPDIDNSMSWTNTYTVLDGIDFFYDFSEIISSTIIVKNTIEIPGEHPDNPDNPDNPDELPVICEDCSTSCEVYCTSCTGCCAGSCVEECMNNCTNGCEDTCAADCVGGCKDTCTDTCLGTCLESCVGTCRNSCINLCGGTCTGGCTSTCANDCMGTCKGTDEIIDLCPGSCMDTCKDSCTETCIGACIGQCEDDCTIGCVGTCTGGCSGSCTEGCGNSCSNSESLTGGNPTCGGDCVTSCSGFCIDSCIGTCSNTETDGNGNITNKRFTVKIEGAPLDENGNMLAKVIINGLVYQGPHTLKINEGTNIELWIYNPFDIGFVEIDGTEFQMAQTITLNDHYTIGLGAVYDNTIAGKTEAGCITCISDSYSKGLGSAGCNNTCTLGCSNTCTTSCTNTCTGTDEGNTEEKDIHYTITIDGSPAIDVVDEDGKTRRLELAYVAINNNRYQGDRTFSVSKNDIIGLGVENPSGNAVIRVNNVDVSNDFYKLKILTNTEIKLTSSGIGATQDGIISVIYDTSSVVPDNKKVSTMRARSTGSAYTIRVASNTNNLQTQIESNQRMVAAAYSIASVKEVETRLAKKAAIKEEMIALANDSTNIPYQFIIRQVPVIKYNYFGDDENVVDEFCNELINKKSYIDYAIEILEDAFGIDFKFFNTYGPSVLSTLDQDGKEFLNRTNLSLTFDVKLNTNYDTNVLNDILADIKSEIEDIEEITPLHIPNLITNITTKYREFLKYFEFIDMNGYGPGYQHAYVHKMPDGVITPELLNINTRDDGTPDITLRLV